MKITSMVLFIIAAVLFFIGAVGLLFLGDLADALEVEGSSMVTVAGVLYFIAAFASIFGAVKAGTKNGTIAGLVALGLLVVYMILMAEFPMITTLVTAAAVFASFAEQKEMFN